MIVVEVEVDSHGFLCSKDIVRFLPFVSEMMRLNSKWIILCDKRAVSILNFILIIIYCDSSLCTLLVIV